METYNAKEAGALIGIYEKTVSSRAEKIGFKRRSANWCFTLSQIEKIKSYVSPRFNNSKFRFSDDGEYLIINSRINKLEI